MSADPESGPSGTVQIKAVMSDRPRMDVGVIIERRAVDNPWIDYEWMPVAVVPGAVSRDPRGEWQVLEDADGVAHFHAGTLTLELFKDETPGYRKNLGEPEPRIYVVLTPGEEADDPEVYPFFVTACPVAAEDYAEDSEQIVEGVPMPPELIGWVQTFIDAYHVETEFKKRKRKPYDPRKGDLRHEKRSHDKATKERQ